MDNKRAHSPSDDLSGAIVAKKAKVTGGEMIIGSITKEGVKRTSNLMSPIMQLIGHGSEILSMKFSPDGKSIASSAADKLVFVWRVYGECENFLMLKGHKNAVLEVAWSADGEKLLSCSADKTSRVWDVNEGKQIKKVAEHESFVNSICPQRKGTHLFATGSDDATSKVWDVRSKRSVSTFADKFPVTCVAFSDASDQIYSGGIDNMIKVWDLRRNDEPLMVLEGHSDTLTGLSLSPDGNHLLSNAMDNTLRQWDMRPYAPVDRCVKIYTGHLHTHEKMLLRCAWSADGQQVAAGSSDRNVNVWDVSTRKLQYKLPGHTGSVNEVAFHPKEPIVGSCSSDKTIFLGELVA